MGSSAGIVSRRWRPRGGRRAVRIIKRTFNDHSTFVIQQKHFLFKWQWVDAWINSWDGASCRDSYGSLEEAKDNLCYFDGSRATEEVVSD